MYQQLSGFKLVAIGFFTKNKWLLSTMKKMINRNDKLEQSLTLTILCGDVWLLKGTYTIFLSSIS